MKTAQSSSRPSCANRKRRIIIKKFRFKLDPLLRLRKIEENLALSRLARVVQKVNEAEGQKERARKAMDQEIDDFSVHYASRGRIEHFDHFGHYLDRLESNIKEAERRLAEIQPELDAEQTKVMQARKQRRIVEILEERARARYDEELRKAERKELEELNLMRQGQTELSQWENEYDEQMERKTATVDREPTQEEEFRELEADKPKDPVAEYLKEHGLDKPS